MDTKEDPCVCCLQETHFTPKYTYRLKARGWKKVFYENWNWKKAEVAILTSDSIDFKIKALKRNKEGHYIMIKGIIQQEDTLILNIYPT